MLLSLSPFIVALKGLFIACVVSSLVFCHRGRLDYKSMTTKTTIKTERKKDDERRQKKSIISKYQNDSCSHCLKRKKKEVRGMSVCGVRSGTN